MSTPPPPPSSPPSPAPPPSEAQVRQWNMLCHLTALAGLVIPFGNILGPLVVWQIKKNEIPSTDIHGKAAVNFQITVTLAVLATGFAAAALAFVCVGWFLVPLVGALGLGGLILSVIAGIKASDGKDYQYPWSLKLIQ